MKEQLFVTAKELADSLHCRVLGDKNKKIYGIALMNESTDKTMTYVPSHQIDSITKIQAGVILAKASVGLPLHRTYIITMQEPYQILAEVIRFFIDKKIYDVKNHTKAEISPSAVIGNFVAVGNGTVIGEHTKISAGAVIGNNVCIGNYCEIGANTVIGDNTVISDNVSIGVCCSIGTENFEYGKNRNGWFKIPVIGNVYIQENVIIGGNVVIEKGTIGTTLIGRGTQIENLVQIGHEAQIGKECHIVACVALAGWTEIGNHVEVYGQVAVNNRVKVGDNAILLAKAGVDKNVKPNTVVSGFPAQEHSKELRYQAFLRKIFRQNKKDVKKMVIPNPLPDYGNGRSILSKVIGGVVRLAKKVWDVVTGKDETQEEISQQKGYNPEKSQANDIAQLNNLLIEYRTNISSAGNELEREMMLEYADAVQEIMEVFDKYNSTLKIARTETIKHRFKRIGNDLKGTFSDYISQKISLDNSDFVSILRLPAGEMKNNRLQEIKQKVFIEAGNDIICKIKDAIDDFHDSVEDAFYEHLDRAEQSVTEKNKAFEKMSEVTDTDTESLENMLLQSEYIVSVCSYADDVI